MESDLLVPGFVSKATPIPIDRELIIYYRNLYKQGHSSIIQPAKVLGMFATVVKEKDISDKTAVSDLCFLVEKLYGTDLRYIIRRISRNVY